MHAIDYLIILVKAMLAVALGGLIGMERENKHRPAGLRTHILVCIGSATIMMLSDLLFRRYYAEFGILSDPARMGSQVISGIGFLGAGTIIHFGTSVKGLTTAASLWAVAAVGLAIGSGFYFLAIVVTIIIYITLIIFNRISHNIEASRNKIELMIQARNDSRALGEINMVFAKRAIRVLSMEYQDKAEASEGEALFLSVEVLLPEGMVIHPLMRALEEIEGVWKVERL